MVATPLKQSTLFEVKCAAKVTIQNVLNRVPDRNKPLPEPNSVVVATRLSETISAGKFVGHTLNSCRRVVVLEGFIQDYQIQKDSLPLYQQIDRFLRSKIVEWERDCSSPGSN